LEATVGAVLAVCQAERGAGMVCAAGFHAVHSDIARTARQTARGRLEKGLRGSGFRAACSRFYHLVKYATPTVERVAITLTEFDQRRYLRLINARGKTIRAVVAELKATLGLATALDAGYDVGFFAQVLQECGLSVGAFDGRIENILEARKRFPGIPFEQGDIEIPGILALGKFDLTLCFGLLYHLENPMLAIRHLRALTGKGLLLESMCIPGNSAEWCGAKLRGHATRWNGRRA
jgi:hypothetical protein